MCQTPCEDLSTCSQVNKSPKLTSSETTVPCDPKLVPNNPDKQSDAGSGEDLKSNDLVKNGSASEAASGHQGDVETGEEGKKTSAGDEKAADEKEQFLDCESGDVKGQQDDIIASPDSDATSTVSDVVPAPQDGGSDPITPVLTDVTAAHSEPADSNIADSVVPKSDSTKSEPVNFSPMKVETPTCADPLKPAMFEEDLVKTGLSPNLKGSDEICKNGTSPKSKDHSCDEPLIVIDESGVEKKLDQMCLGSGEGETAAAASAAKKTCSPS